MMALSENSLIASRDATTKPPPPYDALATLFAGVMRTSSTI